MLRPLDTPKPIPTKLLIELNSNQKQILTLNMKRQKLTEKYRLFY